jgi:hypothetical protein
MPRLSAMSSRSFNNQGIDLDSGLPSKRAIFGYGSDGYSWRSITNLVSNTGVVATDTTGVGTARVGLAAASYGGDKAIFGYGYGGDGSFQSITNLVSNTGVVEIDTTGVGTARIGLAAAGYGVDKAIFGYGAVAFGVAGQYRSMTNRVSNTGVVSDDTTGVGQTRDDLAAAGYGGDKAIFGFGGDNNSVNWTNLVSNTGVVANDVVNASGTPRRQLAAAGYGVDKAIFGFGNTGTKNTPVVTSITNLVSNTGVVASNTTGVGTTRYGLAAASYGTNKAIFGFGSPNLGPFDTISTTNLVSNTGVVASNTTGVGFVRSNLAAASFG